MAKFISSLQKQLDLKQGCVVSIELGVNRVIEEFLREQHLPIPPPIKISGLLDTGATATCIDYKYVDQLDLTATNYQCCNTAGGLKFPPVCNFKLSITLDNIPWVNDYHPCAVFNNLAACGADALIGLDVLRHVHFLLDGPNLQFQLLLPEITSTPPPPEEIPMEGTACFDPASDCFQRLVDGEWLQYHRDKRGFISRLKSRFH